MEVCRDNGSLGPHLYDEYLCLFRIYQNNRCREEGNDSSLISELTSRHRQTSTASGIRISRVPGYDTKPARNGLFVCLMQQADSVIFSLWLFARLI